MVCLSVCLEQLQCVNRKRNYEEDDLEVGWLRSGISIVFTHDEGNIWILILGAEISANYRFIFYYTKDKILLIWCFLDVVKVDVNVSYSSFWWHKCLSYFANVFGKNIPFICKRYECKKNNSMKRFEEGFLNYMTERSYHFNPGLKSVENTQFWNVSNL